MLLHDDQLVKAGRGASRCRGEVVPPPGVADEARENYRKQRRAELDARQKRRQEGRSGRG